MSWLSTIAIAVITAAVGCVLSGYVASQAVRWYHISSFEGGSGYFVLGMGLLGLVGGLVIGVIGARMIAATADASFLKAAGASVGAVLLITGAVAGVSRLQADIAPTIDGEPLMIMVEARYPSTQKESPATVPGISSLTLHSVSGGTQRVSETGALWKEDARLEDGRWVVPGAVGLFTERGDRVIDIALNDSIKSGFLTSIPRRPGKEYLEWSEWYPRDGKGGPLKESGVVYRYRLQKASQPIRTEKLGAFEIGIVAFGFDRDIADGTNTTDPAGDFVVKYAGKPIQIAGTSEPSATIGRLALLPSEKPAMLAFVGTTASEAFCLLLVDDNGTLRQERLANSANSMLADELTMDSARYEALKHLKPAKGRLDRHRYMNSNLLLLDNVVLNARTLAVHRYDVKSDSYVVPSVLPLAVAPDEGSFVRFHNNSDDNGGLLAVVDFARNRVYELPIDIDRMRWAEIDDLTPAWTMHHFEWKRGPDGHDELVPRKDFVPLPYHGMYSTETSDSTEAAYHIPVGGQKVRMALIEWMEKELGAKRETVEADAYQYPVTVNGVRLLVGTTGRPRDYVRVSFDTGQTDAALIARIGKEFNAVLATGRLDSLFSRR
ncbi:MAG: hypothetical protein ACO1Q7_16930 [Gemmatimonas sp.]